MEYPFLAPSYSPGSYARAADFTSYIAQWLAADRVEAVQELWGYEEHGWQIALLMGALQRLRVPESEVAVLCELGWFYAADRVARERIQRGWPVHRRNVLLEMLTAHMDVSYDILQIEKNLVQTLKRMGVKPAVVTSLRASENFIYMLADRMAFELEKLGYKANCQTAEQMRWQGEMPESVPAPESHPS